MATMMTACQIEAWQSCGESLMMPASSEIVTRHVMAFGCSGHGTGYASVLFKERKVKLTVGKKS